jgi:phospholipase/carboxylesterase
MGLPEDLEPFAASLGLDARYAFPPGIVDMASRGSRGRAWWAIDIEARGAAIARGPRDMSNFDPDGLAEAREWLRAKLDELQRGEPSRPLVLGGFSQGAMLACDFVLHDPRPVDGLVLFSGARIRRSVWRRLYPSRSGLRAFMSHGRSDDDLSYQAAERFQEELRSFAWDVTWCPFDGGHEIPLLAWRAFKRWMRRR